jgi:hypothetical protein
MWVIAGPAEAGDCSQWRGPAARVGHRRTRSTSHRTTERPVDPRCGSSARHAGGSVRCISVDRPMLNLTIAPLVPHRSKQRQIFQAVWTHPVPPSQVRDLTSRIVRSTLRNPGIRVRPSRGLGRCNLPGQRPGLGAQRLLDSVPRPVRPVRCLGAPHRSGVSHASHVGASSTRRRRRVGMDGATRHQGVGRPVGRIVHE